MLLSGGWIKINPALGNTVVKEGIFGLFKSQRYSFDQIKHVELRKRLSRVGERTKTQYEASVVFSDGKSKSAGDNLEFPKARVRAEKIAKTLGVGYLDRVTPGGEFRPFSELDMSLVERLKKGLSIKGDGENKRHRIRVDRGAFLISCRGFGKDDLWELILTVIIFIPFSILLGHNVMKILPSVFWPMAIIIIAAPLVNHTLRTQKIEISKSHIIITNSIFGFAIRKYISLDKVEEIVDYDRALVLRSDKKEIAFGQALNKSERLWLKARICQELQNK